MQTDEEMIMAGVRQVVGDVYAVDLDVVDDIGMPAWAAEFGVSASPLFDVQSGNGHPVYRFSGTLDALRAFVHSYAA